MRALWLDYQQEEPGRRRSGMLVLALAVLATSLLLASYFSVADQLSAAEQQLASLQRVLPVEADGVALAESPPAEHWEALFRALEAAGDDTVTLLVLKSGKDGTLLTGEASSLDASMAYMARLQSAQLLADVRMTQSEVVRDHPQRPVRFNLAVGESEAQP